MHVRAEIAGREVKQTFHPRKTIREAMKRADEVLGRIASGTRPSWLRDDTIESLQNARNRLVGAQNRGDTDVEALAAETRELVTAIDALEKEKDPYATRTGGMRMAYRSPIDDELAEYGLYVPPSYVPGTHAQVPAHRRPPRLERPPDGDAALHLRRRRSEEGERRGKTATSIRSSRSRSSRRSS